MELLYFLPNVLPCTETASTMSPVDLGKPGWQDTKGTVDAGAVNGGDWDRVDLRIFFVKDGSVVGHAYKGFPDNARLTQKAAAAPTTSEPKK